MNQGRVPQRRATQNAMPADRHREQQGVGVAPMAVRAMIGQAERQAQTTSASGNSARPAKVVIATACSRPDRASYARPNRKPTARCPMLATP